MSKKSFRLSEISAIVGAEIVGDGDVVITGVSTLSDAGPGQITFLANKKYKAALSSTRAGAVILTPEDRVEGLNQLVTKNPYLAHAKVMNLFYPPAHPRLKTSKEAIIDPDSTISPEAVVMAGAVIEKGATVGAGSVIYSGAYIGAGAVVGKDCIIYPNAVVREGCILHDRVILQPCAVIGSDGYGYATGPEGHVKIPQIGIVRLMDDVEVGSCAAIDRAALGETVIGAGTKIDNIVQIGHNCQVGKHCFIVSQTGVSGSTKIGDWVILAGQTGVAGHIEIGDRVIATGRAGISGSVKAGEHIAGNPTQPHMEWLRSMGAVKKLPEMQKRIRELEKRLAALEGGRAEKDEE